MCLKNGEIKNELNKHLIKQQERQAWADYDRLVIFIYLIINHLYPIFCFIIN
jgi:hypothetical protein